MSTPAITPPATGRSGAVRDKRSEKPIAGQDVAFCSIDMKCSAYAVIGVEVHESVKRVRLSPGAIAEDGVNR